MQSHNHQEFINRFVVACQTDERVVAATICGSHVKGTADAYSDLDLGLVTTDEAFADFDARREDFIRLLGEPVFLEDFNEPNLIFFILSDGIEGHISYGCESQLNDIAAEPYTVLLDKKNILAGVVLTDTSHHRTQAEQRETLRCLIYWFWHDLSHFMAALGRGQLWWAYGQLHELRRYCLNLARLRHNFSIRAEDYEKVELYLPIEWLSPLQTTFCPLESDAILQSALVIIRFYREYAHFLAQTHDMTYPADLDRVMSERLEKLCDALLS